MSSTRMARRRARMRGAAASLARAAFIAVALCAGLVSATGCARTSVDAKAGVRRWSTAFSDDFATPSAVKEATTPEKSSSKSWWLESGAHFTTAGGVAGTVQGDEPAGYYRTRYAERNARDTDGGVHPQNLFRLLTSRSWSGAIRQACSFRVRDYHLSDSPQRGAPNGLLLFSRYVDANNLYYAGIRVDGHVVVKKKSAGVYYTLAEKPLLKGRFSRSESPTLLPSDEWIKLRCEVTDEADGSVVIALYRLDDSGRAKLVLRGIDAGVGGEPLRAGHAGIRTDFMDVEFDDYSVALTD